MEDARRKMRICLTVVVLVAVIVGLIYYVYDVQQKKNMGGGTLVKQMPSCTECIGKVLTGGIHCG